MDEMIGLFIFGRDTMIESSTANASSPSTDKTRIINHQAIYDDVLLLAVIRGATINLTFLFPLSGAHCGTFVDSVMEVHTQNLPLTRLSGVRPFFLSVKD